MLAVTKYDRPTQRPTGQHRAPWPQGLSPKIESAYDYLGRPIDAELPAKLRPDPVFLVLPEGASDAATWRNLD